MLHISPFEAVLNGLKYELTPTQTKEVEKLLQGFIPGYPWGFSHWTEAAACDHLIKAGYELISPHAQEEAKQALTRVGAANPRQATQSSEDRNFPLELQKMTEERDDLAMELSDFKATAEGKDVEATAAIKRERDLLRAQESTLKQQVFDLEQKYTEARQRYLTLKDPANEGRL